MPCRREYLSHLVADAASASRESAQALDLALSGGDASGISAAAHQTAMDAGRLAGFAGLLAQEQQFPSAPGR